ncbi:MAG: ABC transporter substrate-binding protein [Chloroflexi bacterium]|nr:ABC transporter substrate-binding protein [Chloroflexota bacterium]
MPSSRSLGVLALTVPVLVLLAAGCAFVGPFRIGVSVTLSGPTARAGEAIVSGARLATEDVNRAGGVNGRALEVVVRDDRDDPNVGATNVREFLADARPVIALIGGQNSDVGMEQREVARELHLPMLFTTAPSPELILDDRQPSWVFRVGPSAETIAESMVERLIRVLGKRRPAIVAERSAWGDAYLTGLERALDRRGWRSPNVERFDHGETQPEPMLVRSREFLGDSVILVARGRDALTFLRGATRVGLLLPLVGIPEVAEEDPDRALGAAPPGGLYALVRFPMDAETLADQPRLAALADRYRARLGLDGDSSPPESGGFTAGYDAVLLLADALRASPSPDRARLRTLLEQGRLVDGLIRRYAPAFSPNDHEAASADSLRLVTWRESRWLPVQR